LVLEKGRIAEYDKPDKLLKNENSLFYQLSRDAGIIN
jgi:ABC-type multidrug transport system fused ATPase/permease subunit